MNNKQQTLVILTPGFPKDEDDSTCLPAQQALVKSINDQFPFVTIIIISFQYPFKRSEYSWNKNRVIAFGGQNKGGFSRLLLWRWVRRKFNKVKDQNNITGILSFWCGECALMGHRMGRKNNIPHLCWVLGQDAKKGNKYVNRMHIAPGELLALSDFIQQEFEKNHGIRPRTVIPPGIDVRQFGNAVTQKDIDILGAGSLISLKQYDIFLDVIRELKKDHPGITAMICGDGPEKEKLVQLVNQLELQNNITLTGELPHNKLLQMMQRAKIFLHTSEYEGFGVVCLEALYGGAQVISFCKPMSNEIKNWHIVNSKEAMTKKARALMASLPVPEPVLVYRVEETAKHIIKLFGF